MSRTDQSDTPASLRLAAMSLLARREHTAEELRQKLKRRTDDQAMIEQVVAALAGENLQSDERFLEAFVSSRTRQGKGPLRILQELKQKGVAEDLARESLDTNDGHWQALAEEVRHKRFGDQSPQDAKAKARQIRFLQYRGFTGEQIRSLFD